ncbi:aspartate aminotransferase [Thermosipho melanesiensis]|uniref:Aminotransferase n=2 Tax=Thermosipho melanesiensis TaxID=46541 RepID=A6LME4_THEM4|nr:pyridoxal phosphate-dependent aminotransferase [Thermosipho melanesiensis]ABR31095.1 aminotransferase, class I and II [Thermosipho melanesiensis BI429]APT74190.1 aspartate aminotransferase [Thermosipho melanesiensis]OOC36134.1 aspartate aminotransferase [Thermosipho melanesiensis]OOC36951.1 aspartate aminotransferase [Thermosipho melanesiensis]OOC37703.1 aspartate aminotransferase [Thermosipho melanesiensis]
MLSKRANIVPASPIRRLVPYADDAKKRGIHVYHLNIGQPDIETPKQFYEYIEKYKNEVVAYTHSQGILELREKFSEYYKSWNIDVQPDEIMVTNGGSEAIMFALGVICDPGDEVIVIEPFYANYAGFAAYLNVKLVPVTTTPEEGYRMPSYGEFKKVVSPKTKAILFSNPSNPTGVVYTKEELEVVAKFAKEYNLTIISDEVYREFTFDGSKALSMFEFEDIRNQLIIVDSLSKRYSACGARIGTFVTKNKEFYSAALKFAQARLCPAETTQYGALGLLEADEEYMKKVIEEYKIRRDVAFEEISKIQDVVVKKPQGAFYLAAKLPVVDSEEFIKWMLSNFEINGKTTMVAPLSGFYATPGLGKSEIRIAYVLNAEKLRDAILIIAKAVEEYNKSK